MSSRRCTLSTSKSSGPDLCFSTVLSESETNSTLHHGWQFWWSNQLQNWSKLLRGTNATVMLWERSLIHCVEMDDCRLTVQKITVEHHCQNGAKLIRSPDGDHHSSCCNRDGGMHTPSIAFRHLPPNSARFSYATEGALFYLHAAVQRRGLHPPKGSGTKYDCRSNLAPKHARKHETHPPQVRKRVLSRFKWFWFYLSWRKQHGQL